MNSIREVLEYLAGAVHGLDDSPRLSVIPVLVERREDLAASEQELTSKLEDRFLLTEGAVGNLIVAIIITLKRDAEAGRGILAHEGLRELPRPGEYAGKDLRTMAARLEERARLAPQELAEVEEGLRHLRHAAPRALQSIWIHATDAANRMNTLKVMASGRYVSALFGWVPVSQRNRVVEIMTRLGDRILYTFEPADEHHELARVPVMLENPAWVRPFEPFISFLNLPRYDGWDPTWITAALFPLWVGMIIGDVGYGLVFVGIAWYLSTLVRGNQDLRVDFFRIRLTPEAVAQLVLIMKPMIAWTILWGFLYGECFRQSISALGNFRDETPSGIGPHFDSPN